MPLDEKWAEEERYPKFRRRKTDWDRRHDRYLRGKHWQTTKSRAIEAVDYRCEWCGRYHRKLQVHHKHYRTLGHERLSDLLVLCPKCHMKAHGVTLHN